MDREKRRNIIRKIVRFWFKHEMAIAIGLILVFILTTTAVLYVCFAGERKPDEDETVSEETTYAGIFDTDESGQIVKSTRNTRKTVTTTTSGGEVEEEEYKTVLEYNADTKPGYMNNCIFLGDSRTVAMVSYGFVSDENVLAKVGISHQAVMSTTFVQNSGKQYTIAQYLKTHKAPVIYIGYGVNGMNGNEEQYEKSYKEVVEKIMDLAPDSEIVLMAIWPVNDYGSYKNTVRNEWVNKYNDFLKTLAEYEGIFYLDVDTILRDSDGQIKGEYDAGDGLHYRACAYTVILEYIIHHPVKGISDDGEFVVKYVKPTGDFKKMMKETTTLPANVQVVEPEELNQEVNEELLITPSPTVTAEQSSSSESQSSAAKPTLSPSPTLIPTPTPVPTQSQQENKPTPTPVPDVKPTPVPEPTDTPTEAPPEPTEEPKPEPTVETPTEAPTPEPEVTTPPDNTDSSNP